MLSCLHEEVEVRHGSPRQALRARILHCLHEAPGAQPWQPQPAPCREASAQEADYTMSLRLPGLRTVADAWPDLDVVKNVLQYVRDGNEVLLCDADFEPFAVIVPIEEYRGYRGLADRG